MVKQVPLTQGKVALVDDEDFDRVMTLKWCVYRGGKDSPRWYAKHDFWNGGDQYSELMHRFILGDYSSPDIDHKDKDGLNNQKENLRPATRSQNNANSRLRSDNTSGYKGVSWHAQRGKWASWIWANGMGVYLGIFVSPIDAAKAYDRAAKEWFGDFASVNFPSIDKGDCHDS